MIDDRVDGRLTPQGDEVAMAHALDELAENPDNRGTLRKASPERTIKHFHYRRMAAHLYDKIKEYDDLVVLIFWR